MAKVRCLKLTSDVKTPTDKSKGTLLCKKGDVLLIVAKEPEYLVCSAGSSTPPIYISLKNPHILIFMELNEWHKYKPSSKWRRFAVPQMTLEPRTILQFPLERLEVLLKKGN